MFVVQNSRLGEGAAFYHFQLAIGEFNLECRRSSLYHCFLAISQDWGSHTGVRESSSVLRKKVVCTVCRINQSRKVRNKET